MPKHKNIKSAPSLTPQQERFCYEFLKDLNATQATIRAGYSEKTARQQGARLLSNANIQDFIARINTERIEEVKIDANFVLAELFKIANSDLIHAFKEDGTLKEVKDMPPELRKAVSSIEVTELFEGKGKDRKWIGYVKKMKLWSKDKALENLGRHLKLFTDKLEHGGKVEFAEKLRKARERAKGK